ncbi:MAG: glycosyltransferase family 4 protein [Chloroflexaceae bacterium]|nr:glycosyltransferase family 4 protein [Chloroflexaceae bacterium]
MSHLHTPHVLWITERFYPDRGGLAQSCDRIVTALRSNGITIDVLHLGRRGSFRQRQRANGTDYIVAVGNDPPHTLAQLWPTLAAQHQAVPWQWVVAFGGQLPLLAAPILAAWLRLPLLVCLRGNDFDVGIFSARQRPILYDALQRAAQVCVVSRDKAARINALFPHIHPVYIPNGINVAEWQLLPSDQQRATAWHAEHVADGRRVIGLFGQLKAKKGGLLLLRAIRASGCAERLHLTIVGDIEPSLAAWLDTHAEALTWSYTPYIDHGDLPWRYASCDLVAVPSLYDGLPNVVLEAAALRVPLLAAAVGGMSDVLVDGEHGILFAPGDVHDCRLALTRAALLDNATLQQYGAACHALVADHLTHTCEAAAYRAIFEQPYEATTTQASSTP